MPRLAGKVVFITGAGSGIGRAAAILSPAKEQRRTRLLYRVKGWNLGNHPVASCRLCAAKSSRQCDCAIGDDDRASSSSTEAGSL
jgi:hypothetical protein